jgi:hypothetical protein
MRHLPIAAALLAAGLSTVDTSPANAQYAYPYTYPYAYPYYSYSYPANPGYPYYYPYAYAYPYYGYAAPAYAAPAVGLNFSFGGGHRR